MAGRQQRKPVMVAEKLTAHDGVVGIACKGKLSKDSI